MPAQKRSREEEVDEEEYEEDSLSAQQQTLQHEEEPDAGRCLNLVFFLFYFIADTSRNESKGRNPSIFFSVFLIFFSAIWFSQIPKAALLPAGRKTPSMFAFFLSFRICCCYCCRRCCCCCYCWEFCLLSYYGLHFFSCWEVGVEYMCELNVNMDAQMGNQEC